jgi:hypothetical protein
MSNVTKTKCDPLWQIVAPGAETYSSRGIGFVPAASLPFPHCAAPELASFRHYARGPTDHPAPELASFRPMLPAP